MEIAYLFGTSHYVLIEIGIGGIKTWQEGFTILSEKHVEFLLCLTL
jgi:hypothetical protein